MSPQHPLRLSLSAGAAALVAAALCAASPAAAAPSDSPSPVATGSAHATASSAAPVAADVSAAEDVKLTVSVSKPEDREAFQAGEIANYSVTASNESDQTIPSLTLTGDPSALAGKVRYKNNGPLEARSTSVQNLAPGESVTLKFSLVILINDDVPPGTVLNVPFTAQAVDAEGKPLGAPATKRSQIIVDPRGAAVKASLSAGDQTKVKPGNTVSYTARVANTGDTTTGELSLAGDFSDVFDDATLVPGSVTYSGGVGSKHGAPSDVPDTVLWVGELGYAVPAISARSLSAGDEGSDTITVSFTVKVKDTAPVGATLGAKLTVSGAEVNDDTCAAGACEVKGPVVVARATPTPTPTTKPSPTTTPTTKPTTRPTVEPSPGTTEPTQPTSATTASSDAPQGTSSSGGKDGGELAHTGASAALPVGTALSLAAGGAVLLAATRRRRHG